MTELSLRATIASYQISSIHIEFDPEDCSPTLTVSSIRRTTRHTVAPSPDLPEILTQVVGEIGRMHALGLVEP